MAAGWPWPLPALHGPTALRLSLWVSLPTLHLRAPSRAASVSPGQTKSFSSDLTVLPSPSREQRSTAAARPAWGCTHAPCPGLCRVLQMWCPKPEVDRECHMPRSWGDAAGWPEGVARPWDSPLQSWSSTGWGTARKPRTHPGSCSRGMAFSQGGSSKSTEIFWQLMHHLQKNPLHPTTLHIPPHPA